MDLISGEKIMDKDIKTLRFNLKVAKGRLCFLVSKLDILETSPSDKTRFLLPLIDKEENIIEDLENAIIKLSEKDKDIIHLKDFKGLPYKKIAKELNITENTAKMRHYHALKKLKNLFLK